MSPDRRVAVITGGAKGLGRSCADRLGADGYRLVLLGQDTEALGTAVVSLSDVTEAIGVPTDVRDRSACRVAVAAAVDHFGRVDVVVNSAAVYPRKPVLDISAQDWQFVFQTNVLGTYNMMVEAINEMRKRSHGRIVNITSIDGFKAHPANAHYAATKAAVISLTRSLALEVAPLGILVNSVAPGPMATETAKRTDWYAPMVAALPTKTPIEPDEIARLVAFLASDANVSIAGENIVVSGAAVIV